MTNDAPKTFHDTGVDGRLADALAAKGITHPFPIQELTLPMALKGADIIGQARTGTGKTLGFGLPLLQRVDANRKQTQALVVVPTRELCIQVASDLEIGSERGVTSIAVYGGVPMEPQIEALTNGVHVVVGTPGRLLDHLNRGNLDLSHVTELVLDEADEMLDMGFLPDVERLIEATPAEGRHTMLFSATMPSTIVSLARRYMSHPTFMRAEMEESDVAPTVDQHFFLVHRMDKPRVLARILQSPERGGVYVFTRTKNMADRLVKELEELGVAAIAIHGDLRQTTREKNLDRFRDGRADVLVATEVAARGLDVENVTHVVNYDCPDDEKMYLHRIGRTARAGAKGVAVTFAQFNEVDRLNVIRKAVQATEAEIEEVFSTSDRLQELFDLPDERPWDHLSKKARSSSSGSDRKGDARRGSSDGRSKNSRKTEGKSERSSSRRDRPAEDDRRAKDRPAKDRPARDDRAKDRPARDDRAKDRPAKDDRAKDRPAKDDRAKDRPAEDDRAKDRPAEDDRPAAGDRTSATRDEPRSSRDETKGRDRDAARGSGTRTRTRTRARTEESTDSGRAGGDAPSERGEGSGSSGRTRARARKRDDAKPDASADRGASRSSASRSSSSSRSGSRTSSRSSSSRSRDDRGGRGRAAEREPAAAPVPGTEPTERGEDARGEGTPQLARRVKVEHLP